MKHTKKLLALLLTLALALGLALPAMAISRNDITITGPTEPVPFGEAFTLSVAVNIPAGTEIVSYRWQISYEGSARIEDETDSILHATPDDTHYPKASAPYSSASCHYSCAVSFVEKDADGNIVNTSTINSPSFVVTVARERKMDIWENIKLSSEAGVQLALIASFFSAYFLLPFFPITYLIGFFLCFFGQLFD